MKEAPLDDDTVGPEPVHTAAHNRCGPAAQIGRGARTIVGSGRRWLEQCEQLDIGILTANRVDKSMAAETFRPNQIGVQRHGYL